MTEKKSPWVGDQVYDADAGKEGIVTDVKRDGTYILRETYSFALRWTVPNADKLTVTVPREERIGR
jgi:hypothetical protein